MAISASLDVTRHLDRGRGNDRRGGRSGVRRLPDKDEVIKMVKRRHGYFPQLFIWRGRRYHVHAVERCWTVSRRALQGSVKRYVFRVRARFSSGESSSERTLEIYQDVKKNTWYVRQPAD